MPDSGSYRQINERTPQVENQSPSGHLEADKKKIRIILGPNDDTKLLSYLLGESQSTVPVIFVFHSHQNSGKPNPVSMETDADLMKPRLLIPFWFCRTFRLKLLKIYCRKKKHKIFGDTLYVLLVLLTLAFVIVLIRRTSYLWDFCKTTLFLREILVYYGYR